MANGAPDATSMAKKQQEISVADFFAKNRHMLGFDNARKARAVGMNVNVLFTGTFVVGCALAGLGGAIGAGVMAMEPSYALKYLRLFLIVVIVGGEGSFKGSLAAALALGIIDTLGKYFFSQAASYLLYAAVFALLLWRPQGLLPAKSAV